MKIIIIALVITLAIPSISVAHHDSRPPRCEEDEFLTGGGDFRHGRWDYYICTHPDDYVPGYIENEYRNSSVHTAVVGSVCEHKRWWNRHTGISIMPEGCE